MKNSTTNIRLALSASALALATFGLPAKASALTCTWNGGVGNWSPAGGWSGCGVPASGDDVIITAGGSTVNMSGISAFASTLNLGGGNALNLSNSYLYVYGGAVTNNGTITIANGSQLLSGSGPVNFTGTGTVVLDDTTNFAYLNGNGQAFSFGSGQTVRGSGSFGVNNTYISNAGLISADVNGRTINIDAGGGNGGGGSGLGTGGVASLYNTGTMQAANGGTLFFSGGRYENGAGGIIRALNGSVVQLGGDSRILNGTLTTLGSGVINAHNASQYLQDVTLSSGSKIDLSNNNIYLNNSFTNGGTVTIRNGSQLINELGSGGALTISGTGDIVLDNSANFAYINGNGGKIIFGSNQSIKGSGNVGVNNTYIVNNNLLSANGGGTISLDAAGGSGGVGGAGVGTGNNAGLLNNNIIEATGNSTLYIEGGLYENTGATIRATSGSTIFLRGDSRIIGGTLTSDATSVINAHSASQYLNDVTLSSGSKIDISSNNLYLNNSFSNGGTLTIRNGSQLFNELGSGGALTISGTGDIILDNSANYAYINGNGGKIIFGSNQSIKGSGNVGVNNTYIVNNNILSANGGGTIELDAAGGSGGVTPGNGVGVSLNSGLYNVNIIEATGGSTLNIQGGRYENANGAVIRAVNGSTVFLRGDSRIVGGTLTSDATSVINAHNASQYLQDVTLSSGSKIDVSSNNLYFSNSFSNGGTLTIRNGSQLFNELGSGGALTISGTGDIILDNSANYAYINGNGGKIIFGSNQSIKGSGNVGVNNTYIVNNNILSANGGGTIELDAAGGSGGVGGAGVGTANNAGLLNNGIIEAAGNSTLNIQGGLYENYNSLIRAYGGSTIFLRGDSRILGGTLTSETGSVINAHSASQYLNDVTLSVGSNIDQSSNNLYLNSSFTNNGTLTVRNGSQLFNELGSGGALTINGGGTIVLDNSANYAYINGNGGKDIFGSGLTIRGSGNIGVNNTYIQNNGLIMADAGTGISIDAAGGSGGVGGAGFGTGNNAGLLNNGAIRAANGKTLSFEGGRYENTANGSIGAFGAGSTVLMNGDANLINLEAGNVLNLGTYTSSTTGAASTLNLRGTGANSISTIGTGAAVTDTVVTLSGANSEFNVTNFGSGANTSIDSTLTNVASSGQLNLLNNRSMTIVAGGGTFSNAGVLQLGGGTFGANSFANSGATFGNGNIAVNIGNTGSVTAVGGTLATQTITGASGTIASNTGAIIDISAGASNSTAGQLNIDGGLGLGTRNVTVTSNYTNANFGSGNAFNNHANVTGSGLILAANATMDLSGPALSGNTINVGNVRTGGSSFTTLTITNNGTQTNLVGAVKNINAPSVALTGADWTAAANGGSANVTISYTGLTAGSLAGQTIDVVNNFDNVAAQTLNLQGNVYQAAQAGAVPGSITLGARRVGDIAASAGLNISNVAPVTPGFNENLQANLSAGGAFTLNGSPTANAIVGAGASQSINVSHNTGLAGSFASAINIGNTSLAVPGSGLSDLALAGQSVNVFSNVYQAAVANLSGTSVNFGPVRQGAASPTGSVTVTNGATGALTDTLVTSVSGLPSNVSGSAPGALTGGQSGTANFSLNTATAGVVSSTGSLDFLSKNPEMADLVVASQTVNFTGTVTELAKATLFQNAGIGTFSGAGNAFTLALGSFATNSGIITNDVGVVNLLVNSVFAETLGGSFSFSNGAGYSFAGNSFADLAGGGSNTGNVLSFNTTGLANGVYTRTLTFNGFSRYAGLSDMNLAPITLNITATITGGGPAGIPEPATWAMMIMGFGMVGGAVRRSRGQRLETLRA